MSLFETNIDATGERGNVFVVLGTATRFLEQLNTPEQEIDALRTKVMGSGSYDEALGYIEHYFSVIREEN